MVIHDMIQRHIEQQREESSWEKEHRGKLAVSEIGGCPRKAMLRLHGVEPSDPFDDFVLRLMWSGQMAESKLEAVLNEQLNGDFVSQQRVENEYFIGTIDFMTEIHVIEHKETGQNRFKYKDLPYSFHCLQVLAYEHLVEGYEMDALLYYQNQANWAEFRVWQEDVVQWEGYIDGKFKSGNVDTTLEEEMEALVVWYKRNEIPERYETPFEKQYHCTRMYSTNAYPGCSYYNFCFGDTQYGGQKKLRIPKELRKS